MKAGEVDIYKYFSDYVMDLGESEGEFLCCLLKQIVGIFNSLFFLCTSLGMSVGGLSKLYKFITDSSRFTPLGMDRMITIRFKHG